MKKAIKPKSEGRVKRVCFGCAYWNPKAEPHKRYKCLCGSCPVVCGIPYKGKRAKYPMEKIVPVKRMKHDVEEFDA